MSSINDYITLFERLQSRKLSVRGARCLMVRNRNAGCHRCADACTSGCITVADNVITVDPEKCIGCGTCATVCPTGAIEPREPDDRELAKAAAQVVEATGGEAVFACATLLERAQGRIDPDTVAGVACLGRIDESMICALVRAGARRMRLVHGDCTACSHASGFACAQRVCATANALLDVYGSPVRVRLSSKLPAVCRANRKPAYDAERREFLLSMKYEGETMVHDTVDYAIDRIFKIDEQKTQRPPHVTAGGTLPTRIPRRRALLLDSLKALGEPRDELVATRLWGNIIIDESRCEACRMCAVFCPTGANSLYESADDQGIVHAPGLCLSCRTCERICPRHAITLSDEVFAVDLNAGFVERHPMPDRHAEKGGPDAIRNSMAKMIDTAYLWG